MTFSSILPGLTPQQEDDSRARGLADKAISDIQRAEAALSAAPALTSNGPFADACTEEAAMLGSIWRRLARFDHQ